MESSALVLNSQQNQSTGVDPLPSRSYLDDFFLVLGDISPSNGRRNVFKNQQKEVKFPLIQAFESRTKVSSVLATQLQLVKHKLESLVVLFFFFRTVLGFICSIVSHIVQHATSHKQENPHSPLQSTNQGAFSWLLQRTL